MNYPNDTLLRRICLRVKPHATLCAAGLMLLAALEFPAAAQSPEVDLNAAAVRQTMSMVQPSAIEAHMRFLADDLLEGRQPGTRGFELAARYVEAQYRAIGLQPAGENNTFVQAVPLRKGQIVENQSSLTLERNGKSQTLVYGRDYYLNPDLLRTQHQVSAPLVFVGYGVSAPELRYDDYAKIDVKGKIVVCLNGAPASFPSNPRAYFSSAATKYADAVERGAVGMITFNPPGYQRSSWEAAVRRAKSGVFRWLDKDGTPSNAFTQLEGIASLSESGVEALFAGAPQSLERVLANAQANKPQAFNLPSTVRIQTATRHQPIQSSNVIGVLPGSDPALKNEYVTYVAHMDHFGIGVPVNGDSIYNGAHDNASGVAIMLEVARAFKRLPQAPKRSILFIGVTAEEWGLLGSDYFASNPTVPAGSLVANMALDMPFLYHPLLDIVPYGADHSTLAAPVKQAAAHLGLKIGPDPMPEQVLFIRSDHFSFIRKGIPALFIKSGFETGNPKLDGREINMGYRQNIYHTPQDDMSQNFDFNAGVKHAHTHFLIGYIVGNQSQRPQWNPGDFFGNKFGASRAE
jgi:hypothetical protein